MSSFVRRSLPSPCRSSRRLHLLLSWLLLGWSAPLLAHEDHDHEQPVATASVSAASSAQGRDVAELASKRYEALVESHGDHLDIWLDRYDTNEPVTGAQVGIRIGESSVQAASEETPGEYTVSITPLAPGTETPITLTIQAAAGDALLSGTLVTAAAVEASVTGRLVAGLAAVWRWALGLLVLLAGLGLLLRRWRARTAACAAGAWAFPLLAGVLGLAAVAGGAPAAAHEGHDHAAEAAPLALVDGGTRPVRLPDGSVFVPKATQRILELRTEIVTAGPTPVSLRLAGEIAGDPRASAAVQTLQGGRVAGDGSRWPVLGARVRRGEVLLRLTPSGSGSERASAAAEAARTASELGQAEVDLARLEGLPGVVSRVEVETARSRVASLRTQVAALRAPLAQGGEAILAPIDGLVASIDARPGTVVAPGETLLTLIDPARLSIEALAFEPVVAAGVTRASVGLRDGSALEARLIGVGAQLRGGAVPVRLDLVKVAPGLAVGQPVSVFLERSVTVPGLRLPLDAVVRLTSGERVVYEKIGAERFVPRTVRIRQVSGDRIVVLEGLEPQARVVVRGAPLIAQIR